MSKELFYKCQVYVETEDLELFVIEGLGNYFLDSKHGKLFQYTFDDDHVCQGIIFVPLRSLLFDIRNNGLAIVNTFLYNMSYKSFSKLQDLLSKLPDSYFEGSKIDDFGATTLYVFAKALGIDRFVRLFDVKKYEEDDSKE